MGCAFSNTSSDKGSNRRVFDVANIDDNGQERSAGKIEVTDTELVLHYPGRDSIQWPLQSLRRYGYNEHLFSFESGRRCPTGHGIYAFRCANAEMLFTLLQQAIMRAGEERARILDSGTRGADHYASATSDWSRASAAHHRSVRIQDGRPENQFADYINYPHLSTAWRTYANQAFPDQNHWTPFQGPGPHTSGPRASSSRGGSIQYADLDLPVFCDVVEMEDYDEDAEVFQTPEVPGNDCIRSAYVNLPVISGNQIPLFSRDPGTSREPNVSTRGSPTGGAVNYAQLDLETPLGDPELNPCLDGVSVKLLKSDCPVRGKSETYAAIDFQRTRALSTRASVNGDEGFRKTRHNSNIEMLTRN